MNKISELNDIFFLPGFNTSSEKNLVIPKKITSKLIDVKFVSGF